MVEVEKLEAWLITFIQSLSELVILNQGHEWGAGADPSSHRLKGRENPGQVWIIHIQWENFYCKGSSRHKPQIPVTWVCIVFVRLLKALQNSGPPREQASGDSE